MTVITTNVITMDMDSGQTFVVDTKHYGTPNVWFPGRIEFGTFDIFGRRIFSLFKQTAYSNVY